MSLDNSSTTPLAIGPGVVGKYYLIRLGEPFLNTAPHKHVSDSPGARASCKAFTEHDVSTVYTRQPRGVCTLVGG